ncbi:MAG: superoxide dismutase [Ignavibacteria bacterium]|nr:superoxide dismutase [Ignavibacteria bacterium]
MKILAIEKEADGFDEGKLSGLLKPEAKQVWNLYKNGTVREIYFTQYDHRAVLVLECESETAAIEILNTLPLVKEKLIRFQILPLQAYDGFERLFNN